MVNYGNSFPKNKFDSNKKEHTIMKKTYMQPAILLTKVAMQQMVCESGPKVAGTTNDTNGLLSREAKPDFSLWDDDEE